MCLGESPREGNPNHPPREASGFGDSPTWGNAKLSRQTPKWVARMRRLSGGGEGGGGQFRHFSNNSTMKQYFKMLLSHKDVYSLPSPYCSVKVCSSPSTCCKEKSGTYYSEAQPINRRQIFFIYIFWGDFFLLFVQYSALLHPPPLRFHCADGCWNRT
jgi:hypothetical protein